MMSLYRSLIICGEWTVQEIDPRTTRSAKDRAIKWHMRKFAIGTDPDFPRNHISNECISAVKTRPEWYLLAIENDAAQRSSGLRNEFLATLDIGDQGLQRDANQ